jgi:uncharacterized hydrophobic protein (TIGR00271 family)
MLLTLSVVISTMGLLRDSGAVVIAAMLVAPMMTPILGISSALVMGWTRRAFLLLFAVAVAAVLSVLFAWALCFVADFPRGILLPGEVRARTDPGMEDLAIALAAGAAGAYVQINRSEISLLPGAAIGVSLIPPLSSSGILTYFDEHDLAFDAALLFGTNLGAIILAACVVYVLTGATSVLRKGRRRRHFVAGLFLTGLFLAAIVAQLGRATYLRYLETDAEARLVRLIVEWADPVSVEVLRVDVKPHRQIADVWVMVDLPADAQFRVASIADLLPQDLKRESLKDLVLDRFGPGYRVIIRYSTRISGAVALGSDEILPAPAPDASGEVSK